MDKKCTLVIKDEVNCSVRGLQNQHKDKLKAQYAIFSPTRFYNIKFKLGQWDGKIMFFKDNGDTYLHLLDEIVPYLDDVGYDIELVDNRRSKICEPDPIDNQYLNYMTGPDGNPLILRDHQVDVINTLIKHGNGIGKASTGSGKTYVTGCLTKIYEEACGFNVITIVPNKTLVRQTHKDYVLMGIDAGVYYGDKKELNHIHLVSTWQSLKNKPELMDRFHAVIVDEAHMVKGPILQTLLLKHGRNLPVRFGVTGTMPKEEIDEMTVHMALGPERIDIPAHTLIEKGLLSNLDIEIYELEHDLAIHYDAYLESFRPSLVEKKPVTYKQFRDTFLPDYQSEKKFNNNSKEHMAWIAQKLVHYRDNYGNVLCLVDGVKYGKDLANMIEGGVFLSGSDKVKDREKIYAEYADRDDIILIATSQIASTGLNIKRIFTLAYINFGKSGIKTVQSIGRGLRMDVDKNKVKVLDIYADLKYSRRHSRERINFYKEAKYPYKKQIVKFKGLDSDIFD